MLTTDPSLQKKEDQSIESSAGNETTKSNESPTMPVLPLHPSDKPMLKKGPLSRFQTQRKQQSGFTSPTDNLQSPATKKIEERRKHMLQTAKPVNLASRLAQESLKSE